MVEEPVLPNDDAEMEVAYNFDRDKNIDIKVYPEVDQQSSFKAGDKLPQVKPPSYDNPKYTT